MQISALDLLNSHLGRTAIGATGGAVSALLYNSGSQEKNIDPLNAAMAGALLGLGSKISQDYFSKLNMPNNIISPQAIPVPRQPKQYTHGWKLHLNVDDQYIPDVSSQLDDLGFPYKSGKNSGQAGKSMTVYVGSKDDAMNVAQRLSQNPNIKPPEGDVLIDDAQLVGNVWGRFDMPREAKGWHQYGFGGIPLKNDHWQVLRYGDSSLKQQFIDAAHQELIDLYGDFYLGT